METESRRAGPQLPSSFQRLVARRTGNSFREVAEVETDLLPALKQGEVGEGKKKNDTYDIASTSAASGRSCFLT